MTKRTRGWLIGAGALVVVLIAVTGWAAWRYGQAAWWSVVSLQDLAEDEAEAVAACGDPGWTGLLKVLAQDLETGCPATWFAEQAATHVRPRHRQRARWLRDTLADATRSPRTRFRAGSALMLAGREVPPDLIVIATTAAVPSEVLVDGVERGVWPSSFITPALRDRVQVHMAPPDDPAALASLVTGLRHAALLDEASPAVDELVQTGLDVLGLDRREIDTIRERREQGLSLGSFPSDAVRRVVGGGAVCAGEAAPTPACLRWLADALEEHGRSEGLLAPSAERTPGLEALVTIWEVRDDQDPGRAGLLLQEVQAMRAWVAELERPGERAARLRSLLSGGRLDGEAWSSGALGLEHVLVRHSGPPWSQAVLALVLGRAVGLSVDVGHDDGQVWIRLQDGLARVGACGRWEAPDPEWTPGEAWPLRAVLAQATLEEARAARLRQDAVTAARLAALAERLDPAGAEGAVARLQDEGASPVVAAALALTRPDPVQPPEGALTSRRAQSQAPWTNPPSCGIPAEAP